MTGDDEHDAALFAEIVQAPHDDAPRLVYADWLLERGDPRGELIALQCKKKPLTKAEAVRVATLIHENKATWLGQLSRVASRSVVAQFERGFLAGFDFRANPPAIANQTRTVALLERINLDLDRLPVTSQFLPWLLRQSMPSLRSINGADRALVHTLLTSVVPRPIERLGFHSKGLGATVSDHQLTHALSDGVGLPSLRTIVAHDANGSVETMAWVFKARRQRPLTVQFYAAWDVSDWMSILNERYRASKTVSHVVLGGWNEPYHDTPSKVVIAQDKRGTWSTLRIENAPTLDTIIKTLRALVPWSARRIVIEGVPGGRSKANTTLIREAAKHLPRLQLDMS